MFAVRIGNLPRQEQYPFGTALSVEQRVSHNAEARRDAVIAEIKVPSAVVKVH